MPCYIRMKRIFLQGLLWLYLLGFGFMALSLEPGFLDFDNLPDTNFSCVGKVIGGYYADLETNCQMFHVCTIGQLDEPMDIRFLCLNGTVFDQETRVCERIDEVDCSKSEQFYSLNLELYGNTQPAILEESPETEQPLIIKSTTTTTTTTTTPKPKTTRAPFYTTVTSPTVTTAGNPQVISTHHFPIVNPSSTDVRFNPEEINISLHPGAPPDIRTKPVTYHQQSFSDSNTDTNKVIVTNHSENKIIVTTHSADFENEKVLPNQGQGLIERPQTQVSTTKKPHNYVSHKTVASSYNRPTPSDINYEFSYHQTEPNEEYQTEVPQNFHFHSNFRPSQAYAGLHNSHAQHYQASSYDNNYTPTTTKILNYQPKAPTTLRNYYVQSLKPPPPPNQHQHYPRHQTEKPQRVQLPLPLLPTLPSLTFSSPAPFALQHHIETKRYTKDHQAPPRIIISASASVSDASGRRLNYSLGTIGAAQILQQPPQSYDEYKEDDVVLDPFYHDVPKIKRSRQKRSAEAKIKHSDIIRNEQEAVDVLKFLFEWYKNNEKSTTELTVPTPDPVALEINNGFAPTTETILPKENIDITTILPSFKDSELFNSKSKYSIVGSSKENVTSQHKTIKKDHVSFSSEEQTPVTTDTVPSSENTTKEGFIDELFHHEDDYVNDNFEPIVYKEKYGKGKKESDKDQEFIHPIKEDLKNLTTDYIDDNIEPIYYRERSEKQQSEDTKLVKEDRKSTVTKENTTVRLKPEESGDTETNNINRELIEENVSTPNESTTARVKSDKDKTDKVKEVNTKKSVTVSSRSRSDRRRGRRRNLNDKEREKEEHKKVVLERLTEKAHTAKDDFNYLRTLYKVLSTTPLSHVPESSNVKATVVNKAGTTSAQKEWSEDYNFYTQSIDTTTEVTKPETTSKAQEESRTEVPNFVPIITSEVTTSTTTEKPQVSRKDRRRGRQRYGGDSTHNRNNIKSRHRTINRTVTKESVPQLETSSAEYSTTVGRNEQNDKQNTQELDLLESIKIDTIPNLEYSVKPRNNLHFEGSTSKITDKSARFSEIIETTTEHVAATDTSTQKKQTTESLRGSSRRRNMKFIHHENAIKSIYPLSQLDSSQEFGTPYLSSTESTVLRSETNEKTEELSTASSKIADREDIQRRFSTILDNDETTTDDLGTTSAYLSALFKETVKSFIPTEKVYNFPSGFTQSGTPSRDYKYTFEVETVTNTPSTYWPADGSKDFSKDDYSSTDSEELDSTEGNYNTPSTQWTTEKSRDDISTENYSSTTDQFASIIDSSGSPSSTVSENLTTTQLTGDKLMQYIENIEADTKSVVAAASFLPTITESSTEGSTPRVRVEQERGYTKELPTTTEKDSRLEQLLEEFQNLTKGFFDSTRKNVLTQTEETSTFNRLPGTSELTTLVVSDGHTETTTVTHIPSTVELTTLLPIVETTKNEAKTTDFEELTSSVELTTLPPYELLNENHAESTKFTQIPTSSELTTLLPTTQKEQTTNTRVETTQEVKANEVVTTLLPSTDLTTLPPTTLHEITTLPNLPSEIEGTSFTTTDSTTLFDSYKYEVNPTTVKSVVTVPEIEPTSQTTIIELPVTVPNTFGTTRKGRGRRPNRRRNEGYRSSTRHRFSTEVFTKRPEDRRQTIEDEIIGEITRNSQESTTRALKRKRIKMRRGGGFDELSTDFPLRKSARPTQSERVKDSLPTTPLSKLGSVRKYFIFNCFGKEIDKFYADPRDCRLFHYCTQGYNKNQLLDMKFVCDLNTYFDDEKLICTKSKPRRCL